MRNTRTRKKDCLKDDNNKVYAEWQFTDKAQGKAMKIPEREIMDKVKNSKNAKLKLGYSSNQLVEYTKVLAPIILRENKAVAYTKEPIRSLQAGMVGVVALAIAGGVFLSRKNQKP